MNEMIHKPKQYSLHMSRNGKIRLWTDELRLHHWTKNVLVFVPAVANHSIFEQTSLVNGAITFVMFSFMASSVYLINDIFDLESDQKHPTKRLRPLAAGAIRKIEVLSVAALLLVIALFGSYFFNPQLMIILLMYLFLNLCYSIMLKKIPIFDVVILALMYEIRLIAGGETADIDLSTWLLSSSAFFFLSMAFSKRYAELSKIDFKSTSINTQRGYTKVDAEFLKILGVVSGFSCVVIFNIYINDPTTVTLYTDPQLLLFLLPFLIYLICDNWLGVYRNQASEDPISDLLVNQKLLLGIPFVVIVILLSL